MAGNQNNVTLAYPGPDWRVYWTDQFDNLQLDIVGFLAVLGEGSISANAQVSALSRLFYLPRLLPAPQALLWPNRPVSLPSSLGTVTGVHSGNIKTHVHHVANILLEHEAKPFTVRCVRITKTRKRVGTPPTLADRTLRGVGISSKSEETKGPPPDSSTIKAKATGPLAWVTLLGFTMSVVLFVSSLIWGDGWSTLATILLSLLSTLIGIGNKWSLRLPSRKASPSPDGDVVIRYPAGNYLVVRCDEDVARELYFAPEEIEYSVKSLAVYRFISLLGTLMLMLGVVCLANARLQLQLAWGGAYILMNIAHWTAAALPANLHWDLSCYTTREEGVEGGPLNPNFTEALWKAIVLTKDVRWVKNGVAAPQTEVWDRWLIEAEAEAKKLKDHLGRIDNPLWASPNSEKEIIWEVSKNWQAKKRWDELHKELNKESPKPTAVEEVEPEIQDV